MEPGDSSKSKSKSRSRSRSKSKSKSKSTSIPEIKESFAGKLWIKFEKEASSTLLTPYIVSLGSGELSKARFQDCIKQEVLLSKVFLRAYQIVEKGVDDDDDVKKLKKEAAKGFHTFTKFARGCGIKFRGITASAATEEYTKFLNATAFGIFEDGTGADKIEPPFEKTKLAAFTVGAVVPLIRLYAFLGKKLRILESSSGGLQYHPYGDWIVSCSSRNFEAFAQKSKDLLDKLSVPLTEDELQIVEKLYGRAMELERNFFAAQRVDQQTVVPLSRIFDPAGYRLSVFSDFDLTCTLFHTADTLVAKVIKNAETIQSDMVEAWKSMYEQYIEDYKDCVISVQPNEKEEFNYESVGKALVQISDFKKLANAKVVESRILRGLDEAYIKRFGEHFPHLLQDDCMEFFQNIAHGERKNVEAHIVSDSWCADLIRSVFSSGGLSDLDIHANDLAYEDSTSTGEIVKRVETAIDKVETFKRISEEQKEGLDKHLSVYIGNSVADLLCLLEADAGIVFDSIRSTELRTLAAQFGVSFIPLFHGSMKQQKTRSETGFLNWKRLPGTLYTVSCWAEIHAFVFGTS